MFGKRKKLRRKRSYQKSRGLELSSETKHGILIIIIFTLAFLSFLSLFQAAGSLGDAINAMQTKLFGWSDWLFPILLLLLGYFLLRPGLYDIKLINYIGLFVILTSYSGLMHLIVRAEDIADIIDKGRGGGYLGYFAGHFLYQATEFWASLIILLALLIVGLFIFFNTSFHAIVNFWENIQFATSKFKRREHVSNVDETNYDDESHDDTEFDDQDYEDSELDDEILDSEDEAEEADIETNVDTIEKIAPPKRRHIKKIKIPLDILTSSNDVPDSGDIKQQAKKIEATLKNFGIDVSMGDATVGPTVTQFTLKPAEGVKLNQITGLQNDLALALAAHPIRIEAPIPGKSLVGIEIPNQTISTVKLKEVLTSGIYQKRKSNLMLALGKDVTGRVMMADLSKMPHLLIAGATGSGKSVCINSMLISLLYQNSPDLLKLILVDPKRVELSIYNNIPHLLTPVITETDKTVNALRWAVRQMDERYKLLAAANHRNISNYNNARLVDKLPYIVIVIDELADLMSVAPKEVEAAIVRLAQMARAVGIHLILATQRPSVNVITGLIKANITSRIAFAVASATDSRTIIDSSGADKLLGNGDMLYASAELSKPKRIQGSLISDGEIKAVTEYLQHEDEPQYDDSVTEKPASGMSKGGVYEDDGDEQDLRIATEEVVKAKRASATLLQSRMRIGFAKASRILGQLEERGIIGPQNSSKPRDVLITDEELKLQNRPNYNETFDSNAYDDNGNEGGESDSGEYDYKNSDDLAIEKDEEDEVDEVDNGR